MNLDDKVGRMSSLCTSCCKSDHNVRHKQ
uniref:Uncharacterized protein n=1 Tax=Arundo donax TaxID=35708 RepID=A0A0A9CWX0_ARUDO